MLAAISAPMVICCWMMATAPTAVIATVLSIVRVVPKFV